MSANQYARFIGLLLAILLSECLSTASDATIDWHVIGNGPPVTAFALIPSSPSTTNRITFIAPTDGATYANSCFASAQNGIPNIAVDLADRTISVTFGAHPQICPLFVLPVSGVEGHVGPLPAGPWSIAVNRGFPQPPAFYGFTVESVPLRLSLRPSGASPSGIEVSWPVCGNTYVLECSEAPASGYWEVVTNTPAVSGGQNTLQLSCRSGCCFFRLRRL